MDSAAKDKIQPTLLPGSEWPEQERAEQLARGAALKWASGIFYRPEQLARLGQYRSREVQRNYFLEARIKLLLAEAERTVVLQYLRALMQGRLVCRSADERTQAAERLQHDATQLKELFLGLGLEESAHCAPVLLALRELLNLHDPTLLGLEVAGLRQKFPDLLLAEAERTVVLQYLRALMQGRLVCRSADERTQAAERLQHDATQLKELFLGLGLEESAHCAPVLLALRELLNLHDPTLLGLEVAGLRQKFPDVSEDHVSALLDLRGDVSREHRQAALSSLQAGPPPSPSTGRRALFSLVPTPTPSLSSCLPSGPCS
ncbi:Exocyst complex component 3-like protein [Cricetulus griseus]|uniref:Exocyst complex component 3-like protein n=1 Tax=Cricetulus griseus TaxID=10029 RepID=G3HZK9_CRIGR|nr:Exocyst complex component 3-like protein [Cricetulus griseus]